MKNEEKSQEISEKYKHYNVECSSLDCYLSALEMAKYKDSQPQIIEIFGKRVKIVKDTKDIDGCEICAFYSKCHHIDVGCLCEDSLFNTNRHFVEVDEDGKEITIG